MGRCLPILFLCLYCILSTTVALGKPRPSEIEDGYFRGRSGNMILKPTHYQDPDISMVLLDQTGKILRNNKIQEEISIYNIADLIGRSLGVSPIHKDFVASDYIKSNFFNRPTANLLIELDSVGDRLLSDPSIGIDLNYLTSLRHGEIDGFPMKVSKASYPSSSMTLVTSLISGRKPAEHGIVAQQWKNSDGSTARGYSSTDPSTWSQVANLPDLIYQTFDGQSLIVSLSGNEQNAKANSVNPALQDTHPTWTNDYTAHFRPKHMDFIVTSKGNNPVIRKSFEDITANNLRNVFANDQNSVLDMLANHAGVEVEYREDFVSLKYPGSNGATQYVRYDLTLPEDMLLFGELQASFSLINGLNSPDVTSLVQDGVPDFYSISFTSVTPLTEKYGRHSTQVLGALYLLDKTIPHIVDRFSLLYPSRLLSEVVLLGSHPSSLSVNNPDKKPLISILNRLLPSQDFFDSGLFPSLYVHETDERQSDQDYCEILDLQLKKEDTGFQVFCLPSRPNVNSLERQSPVFFTQASVSYRAADVDVYYDDVAKYQIALWMTIILFFTAFFSFYQVAYMNFKKDTIIYSTFNPKWENREAGGR